MFKCWRVRRNSWLLLLSIMLASVSFVFCSLAFSCCFVLQTASMPHSLHRGSVIIVNPGDEAVIEEALSQNHHQARHTRHRSEDEGPRLKTQRRIQTADETIMYRVNKQPSSDYLPDQDNTQYSDLNSNNDEIQTDNYKKSKNHKSQILRTDQRGTKKLPQALIIGVKKGGTRALLEFLRIHPDIRAPGPEPHFFDRNYDKGLDWYRNQMPATIAGQITMEKTPSYYVTKGVPERVFNMSRSIKLVIVVRDPVTRAISDYTQAASKRPDVRPFKEMAFLDNATGLVDTSWGAIRIGVYAKHLERWLKYFPLEQIHFVNGERLITDPAGELAKVQDFLGLKRVISEKHFYFNSTKGFPCLKKPEGSGNPHCLGKTKGRTHPEVEEKVIKRLRDFFRPFNAKFYQLANQDFGWS